MIAYFAANVKKTFDRPLAYIIHKKAHLMRGEQNDIRDSFHSNHPAASRRVLFRAGSVVSKSL